MTYDLSCLFYTVDDDCVTPVKTAKDICIEKYGSVDNFLESLQHDEVLKMREIYYMCDSRDLVCIYGGFITCGNCFADNT